MTSADRRLVQRAEEMDQRRQLQISNQIEIINRLLKGDRSATETIQSLSEQLASAQRSIVKTSMVIQKVIQPGLDPVLYASDSKALGQIMEILDEWYAESPENKAVIDRG